MNKVKVPLDGLSLELASGRQLVPGEVEKLSADEVKDNDELLKEAIKDGRLLDATEVKATPPKTD